MKLIKYRPKSGPLRFLWTYVWGPISLAFAFVPLLAFNLLQFPSLLVLPFSYKAYRTYNSWMAFGVWGWWAFCIEHVLGIDVRVSGDAVPDGENAIVFSNHQGMSDVPILLCLAITKGRIAHLKWMVKEPLKYVPGLGWGMVLLDCLFLKRNWADDEANIRSTFKRYVERVTPLWLIVFPEGTRITPTKLAASREHAAKIGAPATTYVMLPRPKGFVAAVHGLRQHIAAVYDITISYPGDVAPTLPQLIRGEIDYVHMHVERFPIGSIATEDKALAAWLSQRFYAKDARLAAYK